jgi:hypothetical protein
MCPAQPPVRRQLRDLICVAAAAAGNVQASHRYARPLRDLICVAAAAAGNVQRSRAIL